MNRRHPLRSRGPLRILATVTSLALVATGLTLTAPAASVQATLEDATSPEVEPVITAAHRRDAVLVEFEPAASERARRTLRALWDGVEFETVVEGDQIVDRVVLPEGLAVAKALATLGDVVGVRVAEPEFIVTKQVVSDDPFVLDGSLWGMAGASTTPSNSFGTGAAAAWANGATGSASVVIGVIDEGIQIDHPDLAANIWVNPFEIPANGIDDDGNGYVDDIHGWDFNAGDNSVFDGTVGSDKDAHGTHVAGTIGAVGGNAVGVAGVNWDVTMMSLKVLGTYGGTTADIIEAIDYLTDLKVRHGINVVASSNSYGCSGCYSSLMLDAMDRAGDAGILFIAAAGNSAVDTTAEPHYPSSYVCNDGGNRDWDCVVSVASITSSGSLSSFSNYGADVDLAAPGSGILSTVPVDGYASFSGTSMATPHVTGAIALCASQDPTLTARELRDLTIATTANTPSLQGRVASGGRLDAATLTTLCTHGLQPFSGELSGLALTTTGPRNLEMTWSDGTTGLIVVELELAVEAVDGCGAAGEIRTLPASPTTSVIGGLSPDTSYCARLRARQLAGTTTSAWTPWATARTAPAPPQMVCSATSISWRDITATGLAHPLTDDDRVGVDLPFSFAVGATPSNRAWINSNGLVSLVSSAVAPWRPTMIPDTTDPDGFLAPWWGDLNPAVGGEVRSATLGTAPEREFVVSWIDVPHYGGQGGVTLQLVLREDGTALFQYLDATTDDTSSRGARSVIGVEDDSGEFGTVISARTASIDDGDAFVCAPPDPNRVELTSVTPSVGSSQGGDRLTLTGAWGTAALAETTVEMGCPSGPVTATISARTSSTLEILTPPCAFAATVDVVVATPTASATLAAAFEYRLTPTVTSLVPASGPASGGTKVTVTGIGFVPGETSVSLGGLGVENLAILSDTQLSFTSPSVTPLGAAGPGSLVISVVAAGRTEVPAAFVFDRLDATVVATNPGTQQLSRGQISLFASAPTPILSQSLTPSRCGITGLVVSFVSAGRCEIRFDSTSDALYAATTTTVAFQIEAPVPVDPGTGSGGGGIIGGGGGGATGGGGLIGGDSGSSGDDEPEDGDTPTPGEPVAQSLRVAQPGIVAARVELPVGPLALNLVGAKALGEVVVTPFSGRPEGTGRGVVLPGGFVDIHAEVDFEIAELCVPFDAEVMGSTVADLEGLRLFHFTDHAEDITTRVDLVGRQVCGLTSGFSPFGVGVLDTERLAGDNRYATAVEISRSGFEPGVPVVFVASGEGFADALAAGAAAGILGGPVLLTGSRVLPSVVLAELRRLDPRRVVVVGGTAAISNGVFRDIETSLPEALVDRLAGADRYDTAALIAHFAHPAGADTVYIATGRAAPDALAGGSAAVRDGAPILLVPGNGTLPEPVAVALAHLAPERIVVLGGTAAVDTATFAEIRRRVEPTSMLRRAGSNRYETAAAAVQGFTSADVVYVAVGTQFPDALAATALAGRIGAPVVLVDPSGVPGSTAEVLARLAPTRIVVLGGPAAVSRGIESRLAGYLNE